MKFKIRGAREMLRRAKRVTDKQLAATKQALNLEAELIMTDSKQNYVPVDLGTLRGSGHTKPAPGKLEVRLIYGGAASPYAIAVHEHPSSHSPFSWQGASVTFSPPGRGPKYLERPMRKAVNGMARRIADRVRRST